MQHYDLNTLLLIGRHLSASPTFKVLHYVNAKRNFKFAIICSSSGTEWYNKVRSSGFVVTHIE